MDTTISLIEIVPCLCPYRKARLVSLTRDNIVLAKLEFVLIRLETVLGKVNLGIQSNFSLLARLSRELKPDICTEKYNNLNLTN